MNVRKYGCSIVIAIVALYACNNDDDNNTGGGSIEPPRDRAEQQADEVEVIKNYLDTHFYTLIDNPVNPDYKIALFDTIAGENSNRQPISQSDSLETKILRSNDVDYTLYFLNLNRGSATERQPTFADSTAITYRGEMFYDYQDRDGDGIPDSADVDADSDGEADVIEVDGQDEVRTDEDGDGIADDSDADADGDGQVDRIDSNDDGVIDENDVGTKQDTDGDGIIDAKDPVDNNDPNRRVFDSRVNPSWFDLSNPDPSRSLILGFKEALVDYKGASGFVENNDGTVNYNDDFANFVVFIPSGLAYFSASPNDIPVYSPLIFSMQLYGVNESDHDRDGIPSYLEDLDNDRNVLDADDNTDGDGDPNYIDADDDNDGTLTRDEITLVAGAKDDGVVTLDEITFYDDDGDGTPNHLDPDDRDLKNEQ